MLSYSSIGPDTGPLVIFLHAVGINSWMWQPILKSPPEFRAIMIDLPGHGGSNHIPWTTLEDAARMVAEVVDSCSDDEDICIVGLSLGAYVAMTLLSQRPDRYTTAMLSGMHAGGMPRKWLMKFVSSLIAPLAVRPLFARKTARMMGGKGADIDVFAAEAARTRVAAFRRASNDAVDYELPANAARIQTRVLAVAGGTEHPLIINGLGTLDAILPNCRSYQVPELGHGWPIEVPETFGKLLSELNARPA